jgi:predicted 3-demethylubiquinone-9 3-methyltransferase (glyoxalase superfamily)
MEEYQQALSLDRLAEEWYRDSWGVGWQIVKHQQVWVVSSGLGRQHQDRVLLNFLRLHVAGTGCDWVNHMSYLRSARRWGGLAFA